MKHPFPKVPGRNLIDHDAIVGSEVQANVSHGVVERAWTNEGRGGRSLDCKVWGGEAQDHEDHVCKRVELEGKHSVVHACNRSIWGVEAGRTGVQAHFQL